MSDTEAQPPRDPDEAPTTVSGEPPVEERAEEQQEAAAETGDPQAQAEDHAGPNQEKPAPGTLHTLAQPMLVPRWVQLVLLPLAILGLYELAKATGSLVLILTGAAVIAVVLNPMVKRFQRVAPHGLAILLAWIVVWVLMALVIAILSEPLAVQVGHFSSNFPNWVHRTNTFIRNFQHFLNQRGIKVHFAQQGQSALQSLEHKVLKSSGSIVSFSSDVLGKLVTLSVDLVLTFVLSIYFLAYSGRIGEVIRKLLPPGDGTVADDYPLMVQKAVSGYVRGQLLFSFVMGASAALLLWLMGVSGLFPDGGRFAVFFGLFYALMELIPYIGPIIGPIPPILLALVTHPIAALWVLIVFVGLQQLEGHVVAPQLFRISLRINPILVIIALLVGERIFGIAGALLALPVATILRQTVIYLRAHLVLEEWNVNRPSPPLN